MVLIIFAFTTMQLQINGFIRVLDNSLKKTFDKIK
jgi:hypothetical protein